MFARFFNKNKEPRSATLKGLHHRGLMPQSLAKVLLHIVFSTQPEADPPLAEKNRYPFLVDKSPREEIMRISAERVTVRSVQCCQLEERYVLD